MQHSQFIPTQNNELVGLPPTLIPGDPKDLINAKQGYSDRKLAKNNNLKDLIELRLMYERNPLLYSEELVDITAQSAPGAGAWLSLPSVNTTINDDVVHQDSKRWIVAYRAWAGVPLP